MRPSLLLPAVACAGWASAHGVPGMPKGFGARGLVSEIAAEYMAARRGEGGARAPAPGLRAAPEGRIGPSRHDRRQNGGTSGQCGANVASCAAGYCCSAEGWCGNTKEYCSAPDCQINYGPGCDALKKPKGVDTSTIARTKAGSVLYGGAGIYSCKNKGEIAITFDDGPYTYTGTLLDKFASYGAHATFFITGINLGKGAINDPSKPWPALIKRMIDEGHQVASHTWSHQNASQLTTKQMTEQMVWNEIAINDILGFIPTYMRPPFSICPSSCQKVLSDLGYHITYFDLDTEGYLHDTAATIQTSKDIWDNTLANTSPSEKGFLQIEHDIHPQVVNNLTDYLLTGLFSRGYKSVTVGQCLGDPIANWYRAGSGPAPTALGRPSTTEPTPKPTPTTGKPPASTTIRPSPTPRTTTTTTTRRPGPTSEPNNKGTCGPDNGRATCLGSEFGFCCSSRGRCGTNAASCGTGCQPGYGICNDDPIGNGSAAMVLLPDESEGAAGEESP